MADNIAQVYAQARAAVNPQTAKKQLTREESYVTGFTPMSTVQERLKCMTGERFLNPGKDGGVPLDAAKVCKAFMNDSVSMVGLLSGPLGPYLALAKQKHYVGTEDSARHVLHSILVAVNNNYDKQWDPSAPLKATLSNGQQVTVTPFVALDAGYTATGENLKRGAVHPTGLERLPVQQVDDMLTDCGNRGSLSYGSCQRAGMETRLRKAGESR